jgi:hypothetical protein
MRGEAFALRPYVSRQRGKLPKQCGFALLGLSYILGGIWPEKLRHCPSPAAVHKTPADIIGEMVQKEIAAVL